MAAAVGQPKGAAKKGPERPALWKVVGGAASGGLVVRDGVKLGSAELPTKLATGAIVQELEASGERLKFRRLTGDGPESGWVSTSFKGKELLARYKLRVWILAAGSRGDFQPYLALSVGLMRAGFDVVLWSHADFRAYAEPYGLEYRDVNPSSESTNKRMSGAEASDDEKLQRHAELGLFWARFYLSFLAKAPVGGVSCKDAIPEDVALKDLGGSWQRVQHLSQFAQGAGDEASALALQQTAQALSVLHEEQQREEAAAAAGGSDAEKSAGADGGPPPSSAAGATNGAPPPASGRDWPFDPSWHEWALCEAMAATDFSDTTQQFKFGELASRVGAFAARPEFVLPLQREMRDSPPDAVLGNPLMIGLIPQIGKVCSCPWFYAVPTPVGFRLADVDAPWASEELWPAMVADDPDLQQYSCLAEARERRKGQEQSPDSALGSLGTFQLLCAVEEAVLGPIFGTRAIRDLGLEGFHKRWTEGALVGFVSAMAGDRFLSVMGSRSKRGIKSHHYCGFWMLGEEDETAGASNAFGDAEQRTRVERFLSQGPKPVFVGFGSCFSLLCGKGRHWMVVIAVWSLKLAGARGIILGGWAGLTFELLEEVLGPDDGLGLVAYARDNILFLPSVSQAWLFPRCAALLIHGGAGTCGAAWRSGTPTIIWPVWMDQPMNGLIHSLLGAGTSLPLVDSADPHHVAQVIRGVLESEEALVAARAMRYTMQKDDGVRRVAEHLDRFLVSERGLGHA